MTGKSHLITGVCALEHAYVAGVLIDRVDMVQLTAAKETVQSYLGVMEPSAAVMVPFMGAYFLGVLLPDIDKPKSILGRLFHIPVEHRTWTHAIYLYLFFAVLGQFQPVFGWLALGAFVHLFWDSLSACGNCWFYKIFSNYRKYPGGAKVKKGHKLKLYRTGEWSEYLLLFAVVAASVASFVWIMK